MTEQELTEAQMNLMESNYVALAMRLYSDGVPGINRVAATIIGANFNSAELLDPGILNSDRTKRKLGIIKPIFTVAVGEAVIKATTEAPGLHGDEFYEAAMGMYTEMMNDVIAGIRKK